MAKFMNAALIAIRDNLICSQCQCTFKGTDSQAWRVKYESSRVYCSVACRHAMQRSLFSKPIPLCGPCPTCGKAFSSRTSKVFCSLACYNKSDQFKAMTTEARQKSLQPESIAKRAELARRGEMCGCLECGKQFYKKRACKSRSQRKFCSTTCYRAYLAKRFDRWIANPEDIDEMKSYDEFLSQEELPCIIKGCDWFGKHLSLHVNQTHGVTAEDFKRAAGFNKSTGVVSRPLAELLQARPHVGVSVIAHPGVHALAMDAIAAGKGQYKRYSKEACEHQQKTRALLGPGPERICSGCGVSFIQSTPMGRAKYCTKTCRSEDYKRKLAKPPLTRVRNQDGTWKKLVLPPEADIFVSKVLHE